MKNLLFKLLPLYGLLIASQGYSQVIDLQTNLPQRWGQINPVPGFNAQALGIGNFTSPNGPRAALHVNTLLLPSTTLFTPGTLFRTDGTNSQSNVWSMWTGPNAAATTEKGAIFTNTNDFCMRSSTSGGLGGDLVYYTNNTFERMRIKGGAGFDAGYVGINRRFPLSMLHIDGATPSSNPSSTFAAGWRPWMRVGVFSQWDSDGLFVGLKDEGVNRKDAVIAWSDDNSGPPNGPDYLRFIYTNNTTAAPAQGGGPNGIEVGRWSPLNGFLGIGDFYASTVTTAPARRLEILAYQGSTQFRITYTQQNPGAPLTSGVFTDIATTLNGDLILFPTDNTQVNLPLTNLQQRRVGINTASPGNTVEINASAASAALPNAAGTSGLRFSDMRYGVSAPAAPLANQGVLSVDSNGDVVYISAPGGFGAACAAPTQLIQETAVDLNSNMFHFQDSDLASRVGIGTSCGNTTRAKLIVNQSSGVTQGTMGIHVTNTDQSPTRINYGVFVQCLPSAPSFLDAGYTAGFFYAHGSKLNKGVDGFADGQASNGSANFGGYFAAVNGGTNVGIYATAPSPNNGVNYAGQFDGDVIINGDLDVNAVVLTPSDINLKTNIDTLADALSLLSQLQPKTFYFDSTVHPQMIMSNELQYGLIAQDVEPILPELVETSTFPPQYDSIGNIINASFTYKSINYSAFISILIAGMQEQQSQIDSLQSQINSCCSVGARMNNNANQQDVTLTDTKSIVLNQNVPNPFAEQTTITFQLPESVVKAQMLFYDGQGKLIKAVDLEGRGAGQLNVFADDLSSGIYSYALVADGEVIDTKQMVKTK